MDNVLYKTPNETIKVEADFTDVVESADSSLTSTSCTITTSNDTNNTSFSGLTASGLGLSVLFSGSTDGEDYTIKLKATGNSSAVIREKVIEVRNRSKLTGSL